MLSNELKYLVISDTTKKYEEINKKILKFSKIYFYLMKNYSLQLIQIEKLFINNNNSGDINIIKLIENQHKIIKELVKIINDTLLEKINTEVIKKLEKKSLEPFYDPSAQKKIVKNKNLNIMSNSNHFSKKPKFYVHNNKKENIYPGNSNIKNNLNKSVDDNLISKKLLNQQKIIPLNIITPKTNNEFNGTLSYFNINYNNKMNNFKPYEKYSFKKFEKNSIKPINNFEILLKNKLKNKNNSYLKTSNISNSSYYMNNNYIIDEEINDNNFENNQKQISITTNNNEDESSTLPEMLSKRKQRIKYRSPKTLSSEKTIKNSRNISNFNNDYFLNSITNSTLNSFFDKNDDLNYSKRSNTSFNFFKTNLNNINKDNNYLLKFGKNRIYSVPYINNGKINSPSKFTKQILSNSYRKIKKYKILKFTTS